MPGEAANTRFVNVRWFPQLDSTNRVAAALAREGGAREGLVVVADHQTAGRGRRGRKWEAPAGASLLVSVLLRPVHGAPPTFAVALAASDACDEVAGVRPLLKWPNDLLADERKLAGILGESMTRTSAVVVGLGLNVNWGDNEPPERGISLDRLVGHDVDRSTLLAAFLRHLESWLAERQAELLDAYRARCCTLGRPVRVELGNEVVEGTAVAVTDAGHLVVDDRDSGRRQVASGDVVHVKSLDAGGASV